MTIQIQGNNLVKKLKNKLSIFAAIILTGLTLYTPLNLNAAHAAAFTPKGPFTHMAGPVFQDHQSTTHNTVFEQTFRRFQTPDEFVRTLLPYSVEAGERLGIDPRLILAQAALETNWGRSIPKHHTGKSSYNLFGIKGVAKKGGGSVHLRTKEFRGGALRSEFAKFRAYTCFRDCFEDYADLLSTTRYQRRIQSAKSPHETAKGLQRAGYATDPHYASKIMRIYNGPVLSRARFS